MRWNAGSLIGKQLIQMAVALIVARLLGPEAYGIVGIATVFITISTLVMDQGLSAALIQAKTLEHRVAGAVVTANIALAILLAVAMVGTSDAAARFFDTPELAGVLIVLGVGLLLKSFSIVPRALLSRELRFAPIAIADVASAALAGIACLVAAFSGASYWAVVIQILVTDAITAIYLLTVCRGPAPNWELRKLRPLLGFSLRIFASSILSSVSRNADNLLIGRFLGTSAVGYYSIAYRILLVPVQMLGFVTSRVLFPAFARNTDDVEGTRQNVIRVTRMLAFLAIAPMSFIAVASHDGVLLVLGAAWLPAVPVIQILAITGARQAVYSITTPLMTGFGHADWHLRFSIAAMVTQVAGIVVGLNYGIVGVAVGYTVAGFVMTPFMYWIQKKIVGGTLREHLAAILPPLHASLWAGASYWITTLVLDGTLIRLITGGGVFCITFTFVLLLAHTGFTRTIIRDLRSLAGR